jgi:hypothetical protein
MIFSSRTKIPFLVIPLFAKQNPHSYYFKMTSHDENESMSPTVIDLFVLMMNFLY